MRRLAGDGPDHRGRVRRGGRHRDDGRRDRPARARGWPSGRCIHDVDAAAIDARSGAHPERTRAARGATGPRCRVGRGLGRRSARSARDARDTRRAGRGGPRPRHRGGARGPRGQAGDLRGRSTPPPAPTRSSRPTRAPCRSARSPARRLGPSASSGCTSSTRRPVMPLVEVVATARPDPARRRARDRADDRLGQGRRSAVATRRASSSIGSIVRSPWRRSRSWPRATRRSSEIDAAIRTAGFPMGPFELMDLVGIDVNLAAARASSRVRGTW